MKKEEWMNKKVSLQNDFNKAESEFNAKPCKETATRLSNLRQALKEHNQKGYEGRDKEMFDSIHSILDFANGRKNDYKLNF